MTAIVVGGHSRNVGKTSVAAGLIHALGEFAWTAIKISSHTHANIALASKGSENCFYGIHEEINREGSSDTSRFLAAGACRSLWVRIEESHADEGMRQLLPILESYPYVMIESNRVLSVLRPAVYLMVVNYDAREFKDSARMSLKKADAIVAINPDLLPLPWEGVSDDLRGIPQFVTSNPQILPPELIGFVGSRLSKDELR